MKTRRVRSRSLWLTVVLVAAVLAPGIAVAVEVGDQAPDFTLPGTTGENISLSQFRGKKLVLIEFHINDFGMT